MKPYSEFPIAENEKLRLFKLDVNDEELSWHLDEKDREVEILDGDDWKLQFENELPIELNKGFNIRIPKQTWHRVWKGTSDLMIKIKEL